MVMKSWKTLLILVAFSAVALSTGCSSMFIAADKPVQKIQKNVKIVYLNNGFCEIDYPLFPLIPAVAYKTESKKYSNQFKEIENKNKDRITTYCSSEIKEKFGNEVIVVNSPLQINEFEIIDKISPEIKTEIAGECKKLNAHYAFIPVIRMRFNKIRMFGAEGGLLLESKIYLCDNTGNILWKGYFSTDSEYMSASDAAIYQKVIDSAEPLFKQLIGKI